MIIRSAVVHSVCLCVSVCACIGILACLNCVCWVANIVHRMCAVYYDIANAMCITAYVVKINCFFALFVCSFDHSFACRAAFFSCCFSLLVSFIILPVPMCIVNSSFFPFKLNALPISAYQQNSEETHRDQSECILLYTLQSHILVCTHRYTYSKRVYWLCCYCCYFFGTRAKNFTTDSVIL